MRHFFLEGSNMPQEQILEVGSFLRCGYTWWVRYWFGDVFEFINPITEGDLISVVELITPLTRFVSRAIVTWRVMNKRHALVFADTGD